MQFTCKACGVTCGEITGSAWTWVVFVCACGQTGAACNMGQDSVVIRDTEPASFFPEPLPDRVQASSSRNAKNPEGGA